MRGLRAAGSIRANSPKLKNHRLSRWIFIYGKNTDFTAKRMQDGAIAGKKEKNRKRSVEFLK